MYDPEVTTVYNVDLFGIISKFRNSYVEMKVKIRYDRHLRNVRLLIIINSLKKTKGRHLDFGTDFF